MSSRTIIPTKIYAKGSTKIAYTTSPNPSQISNGKFILPEGKYADDVLIVQYIDDEEGKDVYEEIFLYNKFGTLELSPKIYSVRIRIDDSNTEIINIDEYLTKYKSNPPKAKYSYMVDKIDCDKDFINKYKADGKFLHEKFFTDLRSIVIQLVNNGYINTDIKSPNLCVDNDVIKMIDFEDHFMKKIDELQIEVDNNGNNKIDDIHFITYMIFQVYIFLRKYVYIFDQSLSLEDITGINELDVINMVTQLRRINKETKFHPLQMLDHYLQQKNMFLYMSRDNLNRLQAEEKEKKEKKERIKKLKEEADERARIKAEEIKTIKPLSPPVESSTLSPQKEYIKPLSSPVESSTLSPPKKIEDTEPIEETKLESPKDQNGGKKRKSKKRNKKSKRHNKSRCAKKRRS
jgi:hypothetical protein